MARRRAKKAVKQAVSSPEGDLKAAEQNPTIENNEADAELHGLKKKEEGFRNDVERQSAAIRAICEVEIEHLLTGLHLLRSYFDKEQQRTPVLQFFSENLPNLTIVKDGNGEFELQWKDKDRKVSMSHTDQSIDVSLLHRLSTAYPDCFATYSSAGLEFSSKAAKTNLLGAGNLQMKDLVLEEPSDTRMFGLQDVYRTPGVTSAKLSIGMTPKTLRLPKPGEMLLSVHGSPLGAYKEDNMEAIRESEED